jgi:hypothetical protein
MNREKLAQLIYWKRSFTEEEFQRFSLLTGGKSGAALSLRDYLEGLQQLGMLTFEGGRYTLLNPAKSRG